MGNYITSTLLEERIGSTLFGQLISVTGTPKTTAINNIITRAEGVVDGYLCRLYSTPVASSGIIEDITLAIAVYNTFKAMGASWDEVPKKHQEAYTEAKAMLSDITAGKLSLPSVATSSDQAVLIVSSWEDERYPSDDMGGF